MAKVTVIREPLVHIHKRGDDSMKRAILVRAITVILAFAVTLIFSAIITKKNPFELFGYIVDGCFGSKRRIWAVIEEIALLLLVSLAVAPAFKMQFWNIGADGQTLMGCLACAICIKYLGGKVDDALLIPLMLVSAIVAGAVWAVIPSIFKAKWNTNETLFTLMMNYIATQLVAFFVLFWFPSGQNDFHKFYGKWGSLPKIYNGTVLPLIIVALITGAVYVYMKYSKHGYELAVVGESQNTAKYVGMNVKKVIIRTLILSGAICGIAGFLLVSGINHTINTAIVDGRGFTAIIVAWLGKFNPLYMILTSFLVIFLKRGTTNLAVESGLTDSSLANIITGLFFLFIIGCEFFIRYKVVIKSKWLANFKKSISKLFGKHEKSTATATEITGTTEVVETAQTAETVETTETVETAEVATDGEQQPKQTEGGQE